MKPKGLQGNNSIIYGRYGEPLAWELVGTWDNTSAHDRRGGYKKEFYRMPTIDHTDPDVLEFETQRPVRKQLNCFRQVMFLAYQRM